MEPPATIVFSGERTSDSKKLTLTLSVDRATFAASAGKTIPVQGTFSEGDARPSLFNPLGGRSIVGEIKLSKAGISAGDPVVGEFDVKIAETHGGFMTRVAPPRQRPGRPDGGPGAPGPGAPGGFPPGPFGGPGLGPVTNVALLGMGEVQKELELTDNQREQVAAVQRDLRDRMRAAMSGINFQEIFDLSEDERMEQFETIRKKTEQANVEAEGKLDKILNAMHQGRLSQLRLQREGVEAFSRPDVIKSLALSDAQQEKIRGIQQVSRPQPGFGPPDFARIEEQRRKALEDALAILAHEQKMQWSEMTGREFKFPLPQPGFGFGDPGGFGPGN
jgi:hypothetical protein